MNYNRFLVDVIKEYDALGYSKGQIFIEMNPDSDILPTTLFNLIQVVIKSDYKDTKNIECTKCLRVLELYLDSKVKVCSNCTNEGLFK